MESKIDKFIHTKIFTRIMYGIGVAIIVLFIFQAGMYIGFRKAEFSGRFGENYRQTFQGPHGNRGMMMGFFPDEGVPNPHGAAGKIVRISLPTIVTIGPDNIEKVVVIKDDTQIVEFKQNIKATDLKIDDFVVVLGTPNSNSQVEAKLIRVMPNPNTTGTSATTTQR